MKHPITIIWWTPYDSQAWVLFLQTLWYSSIKSFSITHSPEEQNELQFSNPQVLYKKCLDICNNSKILWIRTVLIYCNSLSSVLDIDTMTQESGIKIITPLEIYEKLWEKHKNICVIAANSTWAAIAEKYIGLSWNKNIVSIWFLDIVKKIENKHSAEEVVNTTNLQQIIYFLESQSIEIIILSCTHFPHITKKLQSITKIKVVDLNAWLQKLL